MKCDVGDVKLITKKLLLNIGLHLNFIKQYSLKKKSLI